MKKILLVFFLIILLIWIPSVNAFMAGNESDCAFLGNCGDKSESTARGKTAESDYSLGQLIAAGGSAFLHSISDIHYLLGLVEASETTGLDVKAIQEAVKSAIKNMEQARSAYLKLKSLADVTPYNPVIITRLIEFDYKGFQKQFDLLPDIFDLVQVYLAAGDVRGVYAQFYENAGDILVRLLSVKQETDAGAMPDLQNLWKLNQKCAEYTIFAQYVAQVFYGLK